MQGSWNEVNKEASYYSTIQVNNISYADSK